MIDFHSVARAKPFTHSHTQTNAWEVCLVRVGSELIRMYWEEVNLRWPHSGHAHTLRNVFWPVRLIICGLFPWRPHARKCAALFALIPMSARERCADPAPCGTQVCVWAACEWIFLGSRVTLLVSNAILRHWVGLQPWHYIFFLFDRVPFYKLLPAKLFCFFVNLF